MKPSSETQTFPLELLTVASQWLIRLRADGATQVDTAAWLEWCNHDPRNLEAFDRVQDLNDQLRDLQGDERAAFLRLGDSAVAAPARRGTSRRLTIIASLALAASVAIFSLLVMPWLAASRVQGEEFATSHAAQREVTLADTSHVTLGAASSVVTRYSDSVRHLTLENGEAYFEVMSNHERPFIVDAGSVTVTAVGTKFDIRRTRQRVLVTVTEGVVDVVPTDTNAPVRVPAGQRATLEIDAHRLVIAAIDPKAALGWQRGRLEYVAEPLSSVIEDVNRYAARPILIGDDSLRDITYTGTVFGDHAQEWAQALSSVFPVQIVKRDDGSVLLKGTSRAQSGP